MEWKGRLASFVPGSHGQYRNNGGSAVKIRLSKVLGSGDGSGLLAWMRREVEAGVCPQRLAEDGLRLVLARGGGDLRGARWSHAFLALEAAAELARACPREVALPAVVNALAFLDDSEPTRSRPLGLADGPGDPVEFEAAVVRSDLAEAEAQAVALDRDGRLEPVWFRLAASNLEGWGHRSLIALALWRLRPHLRDERERLIRAGLRHWIPWEVVPPPPPAESLPQEAIGRLKQSAGGPGVPIVLANLLLEGHGESATGYCLSQGWAVTRVADGLLRAACRIFCALPELRQLHAVTVGRALVQAVLHHGLAPSPTLEHVARFVGESWVLALKSGRVLVPDRVRKLGAPAGCDDSGRLLVELCQYDATPNFGHLIKLVEASVALQSLGTDAELARWSSSVLAAAHRKATPWRRVWATASGEIANVVAGD